LRRGIPGLRSTWTFVDSGFVVVAPEQIEWFSVDAGGVALPRRNIKMKKRFMVSVAAAALLAATGFATAQNQGGAKDAPAAAPSMSKEPAMKMEGAPKSGPTAQDKTGTKTVPQQAQDKAESKASGEMNKPNAESGKGASAKPATDGKSASTKPSTAAPPREKQTQMVSAFKQEKVQESTNLNFNISIGAAVPASVQFYPLPSEIVDIYPEWSGYDFIFVGGRYVILRPETHEIIYIIEG
jgi:hypothetical protein